MGTCPRETFEMKMELKHAPRELIAKIALELEKKYDLKEYFVILKGMFSRLQELNTNGRCFVCRAPREGHFFEECVARRHFRIDQLYEPRKQEQSS